MPAPASETAPAVALDVALDRRIHVALHQNDVPVVRALAVENRGQADLERLRLRVVAEPAFALPWERRLDGVRAGTRVRVEAADLALAPGFLGALTERTRGHLHLELWQGEACLARRSEPVELFARDEWPGLGSLPEVLAAFVLPNHPVVEEVLGRAARVLEHWTGDPSLTGYRSCDPRRVVTTAAALYLAIQNLDLAYVLPPASFESEGQRVRLPGRVLDAGMGTCLDLALLAAACLEQAGLHPLLVLVEEHAFLGLWLREESFPEAAVHEPLRLRKRVDLHEILVFDPTAVTARPPLDFAAARQAARDRLDDLSLFQCAIDVARARKGGIRPLPEQVESAGAAEATGHEVVPLASTAAPDVAGLELPPDPGALQDAPEGPETPDTRLERWQRRLLDLSLRNRLIHFRPTKKTLPVACADLEALEDALAEGGVFQLLGRPADLREGDPRSAETQRARLGEDGRRALLAEELAAGRLRVDLADAERERRLVEVYRAARLGKEEGGASALYLALGFLVWSDAPGSTRRYRAPILLLPMELARASVRSGFSLRAGEDEPRLNASLVELLARGHGITLPGLDPLPEDGSGIDVGRVLRTVREAVRDVEGWDVLEEAWLGLFSFAKFLMWRDLRERASELRESPVVDHLVAHADEPFEPEAVFPDPAQLDRLHGAADSPCPLAADSTQLAAVFAAAQGHSFVLEGPPGTGKSQTIANLIAHCLGEGKSVLFVSEKMAALDVVYERLRRIGLGRFCLELHSNKAAKREVYRQLDEALQAGEELAEEDWRRETARLDELRATLNGYVGRLHVERASGETLYQVLSRLIGLADAPRVPLAWGGPDAVDRERLAALREAVRRLETAGATLGDVGAHPWRGTRCTAWTPGFEDRVQAGVLALEDARGGLARATAALAPRLELRADGWTWEELAVLGELVRLFSELPGATAALLLHEDREGARQQLLAWALRGRVRDRLRRQLFATFEPAALALDLADLARRWALAERSVWPLSWWRRRSVRKALGGVARGGARPARPGRAQVAEDLAQLAELREEERRLREAAGEAERLLGRAWNGGDADWDHVERIARWVRELAALVTRAAGEDLEEALRLRSAWTRLATEGRELLAPTGPLGEKLGAWSAARTAFDAQREALGALLVFDAWEDERVLGTHAGGALEATAALLDRWRGERAALRPWCHWRTVAEEAAGGGLGPLLAALEAGEVAVETLPAAFERSYGEWWSRAVLDGEPTLAGFFSREHERAIAEFRALDERVMELGGRRIAARLARRVPRAGSSVLPNSEVGLLKREIAKRARHLPVRRAFERMPNLIPRLKPCLLMSPMSVAQYLDPGYEKFDLVVFDEASQIPVWDAVGAIARARQAVVVGDPKQLPPTSFFQRNEDEEFDEGAPDEGEVEDLESILDDCIGAGLRTLHLDWHYRSRHESLIAFSNARYYEGRLLTFPSPARDGMGVSWHPVPHGVYDKGGTRTNRAEAEAVVAEIRRRLTDPLLCEASIGVVTFGQPQQVLVEDLLEEARREDPALEPFFTDARPEPVFVKNLENVQGDERDVILFSVGYGPDARGKVSMNFGPMNREGGERRLNVAITRARRAVLVFSSLRAEHVDLARTRALGVAHLKEFLAYAAGGPGDLGLPAGSQPAPVARASFEGVVHRVLAAAGWEVHRQVGCSDYRLDLALVDPDRPERYLLAIECDGDVYRAAHTARDRDKVRAAVLEGLGWRLHRLWSVDWIADPEGERAKLLDRCERALRRARGQEQEAEPEAFAFEELAAAEEADAEPEGPPVYRPLKRGRRGGTPESFYEARTTERLAGALAAVVAHEGPVHLPLAARRVASFWEVERLTGRVQARVEEALARCEGVHLDERGFLWPAALDPATYDAFRVPAEGDASTERDADELCDEELAAAALHLLREHVSAPVEDIVRQTARLFGFQRLGSKLQARIERGVLSLLERDHVQRDGDRLVWG